MSYHFIPLRTIRFLGKQTEHLLESPEDKKEMYINKKIVFLSLICVITILTTTILTSTWMDLLNPLALDSLLAIVFWWITGPIAEKRRTKIIKGVALVAYLDFKKKLIRELLYLVKLYCGESQLDELMNVVKFKEVFRGENEKSAWYDVANAMENDFPKWIRFFKNQSFLLREELSLLLIRIDSTNPRALTTLHTLRRRLYDIENEEADCGGVKSIMSFFWQLLAGWSFIEGYYDYDTVERAITDL